MTVPSAVTSGSALAGMIVCTPEAMLNRMVDPGSALAFLIALRSEPPPLSLVLVTVKVLGRHRSSRSSTARRSRRGTGFPAGFRDEGEGRFSRRDSQEASMEEYRSLKAFEQPIELELQQTTGSYRKC